MLTNEQRAHDLALIVVKLLSQPDPSTSDVFEIYMDAYNAGLEAFNREFPAN